MSSAHILRSMQAAFARTLNDQEHVPESGLFREDGLSARQRLNVYYNHVRSTEAKVLAAIYPALQRLVGDEFFTNMAILYARAYPPRCSDLDALGERLAEFIGQFSPLAALPYLPDVARLEWACHQSLHAPHAAQEAGTQRHAVDRLPPHVRMLRSTFPIATIWDFALQDHPESDVRLNLEALAPEHVLVMRPALDVEVWVLPPSEWERLRNCDGNTAPDLNVPIIDGHRKNLRAGPAEQR